MRNDAWFAGFADGEASFQVCKTKVGHYVRFQLILRVDDLAVLEDLCDAFGGSIAIKLHARKKSPNARPTACWVVNSRTGLQALVAYFDRFPLRAKKARDFAIWREAVAVYCARGHKAPALPVLKTALERVRAFPEHTLEEWEARDAARRLAREEKVMCAHGHLLSGANLYTSPSDPTRRYCRTCRRETRRGRRQRVS